MFINNIDPVLLEVGVFEIRWYGLFLGMSAGLALWILMKLFKSRGLNPDDALNVGVWLTIGGLLGARIGHIVFYNLDYYLSNPIEVIMIHHGGLSSHGMTFGLIVAFVVYMRITATPSSSPLGRGRVEWRRYADLLVVPIPLVAGFIRIGNFFNSEIVGRATDLPWAVQFPLFELSAIGRHPSQIYEALIAFAIFGVLLWMYRKSNDGNPPLSPLACLPARQGKWGGFNLVPTHTFIFLYFSTRFLIEFVKEYHTLEAGLTMGQWLSVPFIVYSIGWFIYIVLKSPSFPRRG
ncbi:prolipoprotein diacylglyceryl transferase [Candidatus Uhrbacteria bacterium]|jgi:phosphatidylglycerol---prolipoprotein diacylglyceryl transferase|nr:prolipoprotein diacylglyceryl transferase [Candidatus Uhrbacteria bacterium]MBT7717317.1 prolipoprotein diacylglyceryl transferase [Candidatus Uhrbacteria bacterium]